MARARIARLPAAVHAVHEKGRFLLLEKLKVFFDQADDSLFSLADKAGSNHEQNIYFDSMREVRIQRCGFEKRFAIDIDNAFAALASGSTSKEEPEYQDALGSGTLSLMQNDQLEEMVAIESSVSRANAEYAEQIQQISLRLDSLLAVKVYQDNNPLSPKIIANAFMDQAKRLDVDLKAKLVLFKLFDRAVMQNLLSVYQSVNQTLVDNRVLPTLASGQTYRKPSAPGAVGQNACPVSESPENSAAHSLSVPTELQDIIPGSMPSVEASAIIEVVRLLSMAQQAPVPAGNGQGGLSALSLIRQLQSRTGENTEIGRTEQEVIKLVDMLFNFILEDSNLAVEMKEQISRLQIPIVKVALIDQSFFAKGGHAARRLLNEIATAALGWQPLVGDVNRDPLYRKVNQVVSAVLTDFHTDVSIFSELLADFSAFVEKDQRRAEILERRTLDAEDGKAKAEAARTTVALEIEIRTVNEELPEVVKQLIEGPWNNVLFVCNLKHGSDSESWREALKTLDDLIWSTRVPDTNEERKTLIRLVPDLLQRLRSGLDSISFNPFEMSDIFKKLEDVHLASIRGVSAAALAVKSKEPKCEENPRAPDSVAGDVPDSGANERDNLTQKVAHHSAQIDRVSKDNLSNKSALELTGELPAIDEVQTTLSNEAATSLLGDVDAVLAHVTEDELASVPGSIPDTVSFTDESSVSTGIDAQQSTVSIDNSRQKEAVAPESLEQADIEANMAEKEKQSFSPITEDSPFVLQVDAFVRGAWFQMEVSEGESIRCRLAAVIKPAGKYIFVNRSGMKVAEKHRLELAEMLQSNRLRVLDNSMLFDRALETVVSSLRKNT